MSMPANHEINKQEFNNSPVVVQRVIDKMKKSSKLTNQESNDLGSENVTMRVNVSMPEATQLHMSNPDMTTQSVRDFGAQRGESTESNDDQAASKQNIFDQLL